MTVSKRGVRKGGRERRRGQGFRRVSIVFHRVGEGGEGVKGVHREQGGGGRGERQRIWSGFRSGLNRFSKFSRFDGFRGSRVLGLGINLLEVGISRFRLLGFFQVRVFKVQALAVGTLKQGSCCKRFGCWGSSFQRSSKLK